MLLRAVLLRINEQGYHWVKMTAYGLFGQTITLT